MLEFKQSVIEMEHKFIGEDFLYNIKSFDGKRTESKDFIKINTCKSLFDNENIKFLFSKNYIDKLKIFLRDIKKELSLKNIDFSAFLNLHNEIVQINKNIKDNRSFGFFRVILIDKNNNVYMDDISITQNDPKDLKEKIRFYVDKNKNKIIFSLGEKESKLFKDIPVVFSSQAAGYFIHEILGHTIESDFYSYYREKYKSLNISPKLRVVDSPEGYKTILGIGDFDDCGKKIKTIKLIENGKLLNILSDNKSDSLDGKTYGISRRESYKTSHLPRMRATFIEPFEDLDENDIIKKYNNAIFMDKAYIGGVDPSTGDYNLSGNGFFIKNGSKKNFIGNLKINGSIFKDLKNTEFVGKDFKVFLGFCFKMGQNVRVLIGAPTISVTSMVVSGEVYE